MNGQYTGAMPSLANAKAGNQTGRYLPVGEYVVDVNSAEVFTSRKNVPLFKVEMTIIESTNPEARVGDATFSFVRAFVDEYGYGPNDIKGWICMFIAARIPGSDPAHQWDDAYIPWIASADQPARGSRWYLNVWEKPNTKKAGVTTVYNWETMQAGESRGLTAAAAPRPAAPTVVPQPVGFPPLPTAPVPQPAPAPLPAAAAPGYVHPAAAPALQPPRPDNWPATLPWPPPGWGK